MRVFGRSPDSIKGALGFALQQVLWSGGRDDSAGLTALDLRLGSCVGVESDLRGLVAL